MCNVKYYSFGTKRRFGVELEVTAHISKEKLSSIISSVDQNHAVTVSQTNKKDYNNNHWTVKHDGSCIDDDFNCGNEISTFVGSGINDILLIKSVAKKLAEEGVKVNDNCAVHVHAEVSDFNKTGIAKLVAWWMKIEHIILQMVPKRRRSNKAIYCVPLMTHYKKSYNDIDKYKFSDLSSLNDFYQMIRPPYTGDLYRRVTMNICNICAVFNNEYGTKRKTVELRLPEGTLNQEDIANWIKFFVRFVNKAKARKHPADLSPLTLEETLRFLGLHKKDDGTTVLLSKGLWNVKKWMLNRLLEFTDNKELEKTANHMMNYLCVPFFS